MKCFKLFHSWGLNKAHSYLRKRERQCESGDRDRKEERTGQARELGNRKRSSDTETERDNFGPPCREEGLVLPFLGWGNLRSFEVLLGLSHLLSFLPLAQLFTEILF